jgi:hypothetical protein
MIAGWLPAKLTFEVAGVVVLIPSLLIQVLLQLSCGFTVFPFVLNLLIESPLLGDVRRDCPWVVSSIDAEGEFVSAHVSCRMGNKTEVKDPPLDQPSIARGSIVLVVLNRILLVTSPYSSPSPSAPVSSVSAAAGAETISPSNSSYSNEPNYYSTTHPPPMARRTQTTIQGRNDYNPDESFGRWRCCCICWW